MPPTASSLTAAGILWAFLSLAAAVAAAAGFYAPHWLRGSAADGSPVSFGAFRRCTFPLPGGGLSRECGRYSSWDDIPSAWWRAAAVVAGAGAGAALLAAFTAAAACWLPDVVTKSTARALGMLQLFAALLISIGCCIYPNGWSSKEVRNVCGPESDSYRMGTCSISWSLYLMCGSVALLVACAGLSLRASRVQPNSFRI